MDVVDLWSVMGSEDSNVSQRSMAKWLVNGDVNVGEWPSRRSGI